MKTIRLMRPLLMCLGLSSTLTLQAAPAWQSAGNMPAPLVETLSLEHEGALYVIGGFANGLKPNHSVYRFMPQASRWDAIGATSATGTGPKSVSHAGKLIVDGEAWVIGGRVGAHPGKPTAEVWLFDLASATWRAGPSLPQPFAGGGAAWVDGRVHVFGGLDAKVQCDVSDHFVYDPDAPHQGWQRLGGKAAMPMARNHFGTAVVGNRIYALGGQNGHDGQCNGKNGGKDGQLAHVYDADAQSWTRLPDLPYVQSHMEPGTFARNGVIYLVAGEQKRQQVLSFDVAARRWTVRQDLALPEGRLAPVASVLGEYLYVFGGAPARAGFPRADGWKILWPDGPLDISSPASDPSVPDSVPVDPTSPSVDNESSATAPLHTAVDGLVQIEASGFATRQGQGGHAWQTRGNLLQALPDTGRILFASKATQGPALSYRVEFDQPGTWYLWVKGLGDSIDGEGKSDSVHMGLNGVLQSGSDKLDGFDTSALWRRSTRDGAIATVSVPVAGEHALNVWMREDGFALERILLTRDAALNPNHDAAGDTDTATDTDTDTGGSAADGSVDTGEPVTVAPLTVSTEHLVFAELAIGQTVSRSVTLTNPSVSEIQVVEVGMLAGSAAAFSVDSPVGGFPIVIAPAASVTLDIRFAPRTAGPRVGTLYLRDDPYTELRLVSLEGVGRAASPSTDPGVDTSGPESGQPSLDQGLADAPQAAFGEPQWRLNLGGPEVLGSAGELWLADLPAVPASELVGDTRVWGTRQGIEVPATLSSTGVAPALFQSERYSVNAGSGLRLSVPVTPGRYRVRLYFAEIFPGAFKAGGRRFAVELENRRHETALDVFAEVGAYRALMRSYVVTADETLDVALLHDVQNPALKAMDVSPCVARCGESTEGGTADGPQSVPESQPDSWAGGVVETAVGVRIEAEAFDTAQAAGGHAWQVAHDTGAGGQLQMSAWPNQGTLRATATNSPMLEYRVRFDSPGLRYVWVRGLGDTNTQGEGHDDSVHVGLNGILSPGADKIDRFPPQWTWTNSTRDGPIATIDVPSAGVHTLNLWMREDGVSIDQIQLLKAAGGRPAGGP